MFENRNGVLWVHPLLHRKNNPEPVFVNVYGAQESVPRNPIRAGWESIPGLLKRSTNSGSEGREREGGGVYPCSTNLWYLERFEHWLIEDFKNLLVSGWSMPRQCVLVCPCTFFLLCPFNDASLGWCVHWAICPLVNAFFRRCLPDRWDPTLDSIQYRRRIITIHNSYSRKLGSLRKTRGNPSFSHFTRHINARPLPPDHDLLLHGLCLVAFRNGLSGVPWDSPGFWYLLPAHPPVHAKLYNAIISIRRAMRPLRCAKPSTNLISAPFHCETLLPLFAAPPPCFHYCCVTRQKIKFSFELYSAA